MVAEAVEDFVLIGAGPAGAAAASGLVERGRRFVWLDAGEEPPPAPPGSFETLRDDPEAARRIFFGDDLSSLVLPRDRSPKLRSPTMLRLFDSFFRSGLVESDNFVAVGSLTKGGLTNAWGAVAASYERAEWRLPSPVWDELEAAMRVLGPWIGVSGPAGPGVETQEPTALDPTAAALWGAYERDQAKARAPVALSRPSQAVLTQDREGRSGCQRCLRCLWGCPIGAIYSARFSVDELRALPGVDYRPGRLALRLARDGEGWTVTTRGPEGETTVRARRVLLAAGALVSTALALDAAGLAQAPMPTTPAFSFAAIAPFRLGQPASTDGYGMAQLAWRTGAAPEMTAGLFYSTACLPVTEIVRQLPLSGPGRAAFARWALPAMLVGNGYLPSEYGTSVGRLTRAADRPTLTLSGAHRQDSPAAAAKAVGALRKSLLRWGFLIPPMKPVLAPPGADVHYGGSLPMLGEGPTATDLLGRLPGLPGLHVVDGASVPRLSSLNPTFMFMAHARRIALEAARL